MWTAVLLVGVLCGLAGSQEAPEAVPHPAGSAKYNAEERRAADFLSTAESELQNVTVEHVFIEWDYESNINDETEKKKLEFQVRPSGVQCFDFENIFYF
jgi:hypothetical protein